MILNERQKENVFMYVKRRRILLFLYVVINPFGLSFFLLAENPTIIIKKNFIIGKICSKIYY